MRSVLIEIGGKEREISFGLKTLGDCIRHFGQDPDELVSSLSKNMYESIPVVFYYGMKYAEERNKRIPDFSLDDVFDWLEDEGILGEKVTKVVQAFMGSMYDNVPGMKEVVDAGGEEQKKILIGTQT